MRTHSIDSWMQRRVLRPTSPAVPSSALNKGQSLLRHVEDLRLRIILPRVSSPHIFCARAWQLLSQGKLPKDRRPTWKATARTSMLFGWMCSEHYHHNKPHSLE
ncbi:hypothetical protein BC827DRAFT_454432 [Russula dissimulans]|nr:hypothetical protein BC827DRAFT_454432 [Russula dissimulans]